MGKVSSYSAAASLTGDEELTLKQGTTTRSVTASRLTGEAAVNATGGTTARTFADRSADTINALDYGLGTASTDAERTTSLQAAVAAAAGKTLFIPAGTYQLTAATANAAVTLPSGGIRIVGAGRFSTVLRLGSTTAAAIFAAIDADKIEIEGIGFDGQASARLAWQRAIVARGCLRTSIKSCWFYRVGDGGVLFGRQGFGGSDAYGEGTRQCERIECSDNLFESCWGTICLVTKYVGSQDTIITNNVFVDSCAGGLSVESEGATTEYAERVVVTGNIIVGCSYAYTSGFSAVANGISVTERAREVVVANNAIYSVVGDTLSWGILVGSSPSQDDTEAVNVVVLGNSVRAVSGVTGRGYGVLMQAGDTSVARIAVVGNVIDQCEEGIGFDLDYSTDTLGYVDDVTVAANVITRCSGNGLFSNTLSSSGSLAMRGAVINGNRISGCVGHGMTLHIVDSAIVGNAASKNGGIGISLLTGCAGNTVNGNTCSDNGGSAGIQGDGARSVFANNTCMRNGQGAATGYGIYVSAGANAALIGNRCEDDGVAVLAIGSTNTNVAYAAFKYYILGVEYALTALAAGIAPGNDVVPATKYGAVAFEVGTNGTVDVIEAADNATGYNTAALAVAGLPAVQTDHCRFGWVTAVKSDGDFTFGTTALNAANSTVAYTSAMQDYGVRAPNGSTVRMNELIGNGLAANWNGISNHNTGTYDAGLNRTA